MDEPYSFAAGSARQRYVGAELAQRGVAINLNGQGGDEVVLAPWAHLPELLRRAPRRGWRNLRGFAALREIRLTDALRHALARPEPFHHWIERAARGVRQEVTGAGAAMGWEAPPLLPPWASQDAVELAAAAIGEAARTADARGVAFPVDPTPGMHAAIVRIRASAYRAALYRDAMAATGAPTAMPFFDHRVVEAGLSTRPEERTDPWEPKPVLRAALRHEMPVELLARRTKGHYNTDISVDGRHTTTRSAIYSPARGWLSWTWLR